MFNNNICVLLSQNVSVCHLGVWCWTMVLKILKNLPSRQLIVSVPIQIVSVLIASHRSGNLQMDRIFVSALHIYFTVIVLIRIKHGTESGCLHELHPIYTDK